MHGSHAFENIVSVDVRAAESAEPVAAWRSTAVMDEIDDRELVAQAKAGSEDAFTALVRRYHERIFKVAARIVRTAEDAEDVTQEVFARALGALDRFDFRASFYTWLVSIARNAAFDSWRAGRRTRTTYNIEGGFETFEHESSIDPVRKNTERERSEKVHRALMRLSPQDRTLLVLREFEDMQYEEIAAVLGCPVGTVESGIHRARKKLKTLLGDVEP